MALRRGLWLIAGLVVAACGDPRATGVPDPDGGTPGPARDAGDAGDDAGQLADKRKLRVLSAPPGYVLADDEYLYEPKTNAAYGVRWKVTNAPQGLASDGSKLRWQPLSAQAGEHEVVLIGEGAEEPIEHQFRLSVATAKVRAQGSISAQAGGQVLTKGTVPGALRAGVSVPPGGVQGDVELTISELDQAPSLPNASGDTRAVKFGPNGLVFSAPALVTLPLPSNVALSDKRLGAYVYEPQGRWKRVPVVSIDSKNGVLVAKARHFSVYGAAQSSLDLTPELSVGAGSCANALIGHALLSSPLSELGLDSVNNLPEAARALVAEGASLEDLIRAPRLAGSLRFVQVLELVSGEGASETTLEELALATTLYLPGDGSATITHADALGNVLDAKRLGELESALPELRARLSGAAAAARFAAAPGAGLGLAARLYVAYAAGDAAQDPVSLELLGLASVMRAPAGFEPPLAARADDPDCDGLLAPYDAVDSSLMPRIETEPGQVVSSVLAGDELALRAWVRNGGEQANLRWSVETGDPSASLRELAGAPELRYFRADVPGFYLVRVGASLPGYELGQRIALEVRERPLANRPPRCTPSKALDTGRVGEGVSLEAILSDAESPASALSVAWGLVSLSDPRELVPSLELEPLATFARFTPRSAGNYAIGCRASDGQVSGAIEWVELPVLERAANRPPAELALSPASASLALGESLTMSAVAADPDRDALRFAWSVEGASFDNVHDDARSSSIAIHARAAGLVRVSLRVSDVHGAAIEQTATLFALELPASDVDADDDGWPAGNGLLADCDDGDARLHPSADDRCGDELDDDCDGAARRDDCDGDGYASAAGDCRDDDPRVHPNAREWCDGSDNDCNGVVDDGFAPGLGCFLGEGACRAEGRLTCSSNGWFELCSAAPAPSSRELCDGIDNDCDGAVDDEQASLACTTSLAGPCAAGHTSCVAGRELCVSEQPPSTELCNGLDDDCNGMADDLARQGCQTGQPGVCATGVSVCGPNGPVCEALRSPSPEICNLLDDDCNGGVDDAGPELCGDALDNDCDGLVDAGDPSSPCWVEPPPPCVPSAEVCNGRDDDCNLAVDDLPYSDACGTGLWGACATGSAVCADGVLACVQTVFPSAELCNGSDDDCDGTVDDAGPELCGDGVDDDCDGLIDANDPSSNCWVAPPPPCVPGVEVCNGADDDCDGTVDDVAHSASCSTGLWGACATGSAVCADGVLACVQTVFPSAELCNGGDDDCDGVVDDAGPELCGDGLDGDCDGLVDADDPSSDCWVAPPPPCVPSVEVCNGVDDDCNLAIDDVAYADACGTGLWGACAAGSVLCANGTLQCAQTAFPSAELCNGVDDDCDGIVDNAGPELCGDALDNDCDGLVDADDPGSSCWVAAPPACVPALEVCNGADDDCNGAVDDLAHSASCSTGLWGACGLGSVACANGTPQCVQTVYPSAELCNGSDDDCDGTVDNGGPELCGDALDNDCDRLIDAADPSAPCWVAPCVPSAEVCNGVDDDCNGIVDETNDANECTTGLWGVCSAGDTVCAGGRRQCMQRVFASAERCDALDNDCDGIVDNAGPELCGDALDNDCDGLVDESDPSSSCWVEPRPTCVPAPEACNALDDNCNGVVDDVSYLPPCATGLWGACGMGNAACSQGELACVQTVFPGAELCNRVDDDCDGQVDNVGPELCGDALDNDCDGLIDAGDPGSSCWVNAEPGCLPKTELCNGEDDDCNGNVDDLHYLPPCPTGLWGACAMGSALCAAGELACLQTGFPSAELCNGIDDDCDGIVDDVGPELCGDGVDDDCDGLIDAGDPSSDCAPNPEQGCLPASEVCNALDDNCNGVVDDLYYLPACQTGLWGVCGQGSAQCNDGRLACVQVVFPSPEHCDGVDNDCDGIADNIGPELCGDGFDNDCDGLIDAGDPSASCWVGSEPGCVPAPEVCDGADDNCNGIIDDDIYHPPYCSTGLWGACGMGAASCANGTLACAQTVFPSPERCDAVDNDCDGMVDNGGPELCGDALDNDCDGLIDAGDPSASCWLPPTGTCIAVTEVCNYLDDDCNGVVDDLVPVPCHTGKPGVCAFGHSTCQAGAMFCRADQPPTAEVCGDGLDNDCDAQLDGADPSSNCWVPPQPTCVPMPEICNGVDDDCNGVVDDLGYSSECSIALWGACNRGSFLCANGAPQCLQTVFPSPELCNRVDDNCDGIADNAGPELCGDALDNDCDGLVDASDPSSSCWIDPNPSCVRMPEICNGVDDDCNGVADDNLVAQPCQTGLLGECAFGHTTCEGGQFGCVQQQPPVEELCYDGRDNDCDGSTDAADYTSSCWQSTCAGQPELCSDTIDNDCDGMVDGADPECYQPPPAGCSVELCTDALDNDCDGLIDGADPNCSQPPPSGCALELCSDGLDNDCDGLFDAADPECASF